MPSDKRSARRTPTPRTKREDREGQLRCFLLDGGTKTIQSRSCLAAFVRVRRIRACVQRYRRYRPAVRNGSLGRCDEPVPSALGPTELRGIREGGSRDAKGKTDRREDQ